MLRKSPNRLSNRRSRFVTAAALTASALFSYPSIYAQHTIVYPEVQQSYPNSSMTVQQYPVIQGSNVIGNQMPLPAYATLSCNPCLRFQPMTCPTVSVPSASFYPQRLPNHFVYEGTISYGSGVYSGDMIIGSEHPLVETIISEEPIQSPLSPPDLTPADETTADASPSDIPLLPDQSQASQPNAELKDRLDAKNEEVEHLQTVVGELKVELRSTTERLYATEQAAKAKESELTVKLDEARIEIKSLRQAIVDAENDSNVRNRNQQKMAQELKTLRAKVKEKDQQVANFETQLKLLQTTIERERSNREAMAQEANKRTERLEAELATKQAESAQRVAQHEARLQAALKQVEAAQVQVQKARAHAENAISNAQSSGNVNTKSDAQRRVDALKESAKIGRSKPAQNKPAQDPTQPDRQAKPNKQKADRNQKSAANKADKPDRGKRRMPGTPFDPEQQIAKLQQTMKRQIRNAQKSAGKQLEKALNQLAEEGIGKSHPKAKQAIEQSNAKLQERIEVIQQRVEQRIKRIKEEARRRAAS